MKNIVRTKIVATIGPASSDLKVIEDLIISGVDIFRLNFSHGDFSTHEKSIKNIRNISKKMGENITILADLPGPKLRIGIIKEGKILLKKNQEIILSSDSKKTGSGIIPLEFKMLPKFIKPGKLVSLNDGNILFKVKSINNCDISCIVLEGGELSSRKGINLPDTHLPIPALTNNDKIIIDFAVKQNIDWFALSFVTSPKDILLCRNYIRKKGFNIPIIAKLEKYEVFSCLDEIIDVSDGVMVARGDLGVEVPIEEVPKYQKEIIRSCNKKGKPVITATQMLESMINSYRPTRAEVTDVANAVLDGTDAVMLSGETSVGNYPVQSVKMMNKIVKTTENHLCSESRKNYCMKNNENDDALSVAFSAFGLASNIKASAIICFTGSGSTSARVSRFRPLCPIISYSSNPAVRRRVNIYWGVYSKEIPIDFFDKEKDNDIEALIKWVSADLLKSKRVKNGDKIIVVAGIPISKPGITNMLRVVEICDK